MLLELFQAMYKRNPIPTWEEGEYLALLEALEEESVSPQLYRLLKDSGKWGYFPITLQRNLQNTYEKTMVQNLYLLEEEKRVRMHFEENRIEVIPLKGTRFAELAFGDFAARGTTDIDLLVRPEQFQSAVSCLLSLGFREDDLQEEGHFHLAMSKPLEAIGDVVTVELHWNLVREQSACLNVNRLWQDAVSLTPGSVCKELSIAHTFYAICLHGANHNMSSFKHVLDIVQLLDRYGDKISYDQLFADAKQDMVLVKVCFALSSAYRLFPHLQAVKQLNLDKASAIWRHVITRNRSGVKPSVLYLVFFTAIKIWLHDRWLLRFHSLMEWMSEQRIGKIANQLTRILSRRRGEEAGGRVGGAP